MPELSNRKHELFCKEYLIDFNGRQALVRAGFTGKLETLDVTASRLLSKTTVSARISELQKDYVDQLGITTEYVIKGLQEVAERCLQKRPVLTWSNELKEMVQEIDPDTGEGLWQFDSNGANKAFELLGRYTGAWEKDNLQKSTIINVGIIG